MNIEKYGVKVTFDENIGEISSIIFDEREILYQGNQTWKKTFPICFPTLGFTDRYTHKGKKYKLPKHGFWKHLDWSAKIIKYKIIATAWIDHPSYPFQLGIRQEISLFPNKTVVIKIKIENGGNERAFFNIGFHPAFKIEKKTFLFFNRDVESFWIDKNGSLTKRKVILDENVVVKNLDFYNENNDTLFIENFSHGHVILENPEYAINLKFKSANLQLWKHKNDDFICIEPWDGLQDKLQESAIKEVSEKKSIIDLAPKKTFTTKLKIRLLSLTPDEIEK